MANYESFEIVRARALEETSGTGLELLITEKTGSTPEEVGWVIPKGAAYNMIVMTDGTPDAVTDIRLLVEGPKDGQVTHVYVRFAGISEGSRLLDIAQMLGYDPETFLPIEGSGSAGQAPVLEHYFPLGPAMGGVITDISIA